VLREADLIPSSLAEVLSASTIVFVLAAVTSDSQHLLGGPQFDLLQNGSRVILVSRAAVADFPALLDRVEAGRFLAAIDVWPAEPVEPDDRSRRLDGLVLSAHRAGGIPAAFTQIGDMVVDDLTLIAAGLPPARMQVAARELVGRYRNRPAGTATVSDVVTVPADGVLFDCDGVLVDSDASVAQAWGRWARKYQLDPVAVGEMVHGRRAADTVELLIGPADRGVALDDINAFEVEDAATVTPVPGALELIDAMAGAGWAVVTSGNRILARARLSAAGIAPPDVLITADDVVNGKPDAEGYLAAARQIGVAAERTVVFEDAASGVLAARAAGVGAVVGVGARALETDADVVVEDLRGITWQGGALQIQGAGILRAGRG
jgi:sugar-phosphatase